MSNSKSFIFLFFIIFCTLDSISIPNGEISIMNDYQSGISYSPATTTITPAHNHSQFETQTQTQPQMQVQSQMKTRTNSSIPPKIFEPSSTSITTMTNSTKKIIPKSNSSKAIKSSESTAPTSFPSVVKISPNNLGLHMVGPIRDTLSSDFKLSESRNLNQQKMEIDLNTISTPKTRRQLRNKISARNFRERRKEYIEKLEKEVAQNKKEIERLQQLVAKLRDVTLEKSSPLSSSSSSSTSRGLPETKEIGVQTDLSLPTSLTPSSLIPRATTLPKLPFLTSSLIMDPLKPEQSFSKLDSSSLNISSSPTKSDRVILPFYGDGSSSKESVLYPSRWVSVQS